MRMLAAVWLLVAASSAAAREEPLWEAGLGVAALRFPDYRGSSQSHDYLLPAPYLVYRGEFLKSDREGLRGSFFRSQDVNLNLSLGASLPVRSSDIRVREGMPDLKPSVEAGPSLDLTLWRGPGGRTKLDIRLPVRGAVTIESDPRLVGWHFYPHLNVDLVDPAGLDGWNLGVQGGPVYTDARYNRYFYEVTAERATPQRPEYHPAGGYAGAQALVALSKRFPRFWVGAFVRYDTLSNAAFAGSPLVTSMRYAAAGFAISWVLGESRERVSVDEFGQR